MKWCTFSGQTKTVIHTLTGNEYVLKGCGLWYVNDLGDINKYCKYEGKFEGRIHMGCSGGFPHFSTLEKQSLGNECEDQKCLYEQLEWWEKWDGEQVEKGSVNAGEVTPYIDEQTEKHCGIGFSTCAEVLPYGDEQIDKQKGE